MTSSKYYLHNTRHEYSTKFPFKYELHVPYDLEFKYVYPFYVEFKSQYMYALARCSESKRCLICIMCLIHNTHTTFRCQLPKPPIISNLNSSVHAWMKCGQTMPTNGISNSNQFGLVRCVYGMACSIQNNTTHISIISCMHGFQTS